jgi:hypothetical protein
MLDLVRSTVHASIAITAAGTLALTPAAFPTEPHISPTMVAGVKLSATATLLPATPPPGALVQQFLANQATDCSLICPFIVQFATQPLINFAIIPATFARELQSGEPLLQAIALTDATVSGPANAALTGIITNDLDAALPRAQFALEVAVIGMIGIGTTAVTAPGNLLQAINTARADLFGALQKPPGTTPPAVHSTLEAAAVRMIEVASALTFQAPERLLLGVTQAADAFFTTVGTTGNIGTALKAVGASVKTTVDESGGFIRHALTEPIPIAAPSPAVTTTTTTNAIRPRALAVTGFGQIGVHQTPAATAVSTPKDAKPVRSVRNLARTAKAVAGTGRKQATK